MSTSRSIAVHYDSDYERHDTGAGHPESILRYRTLCAALEQRPEEIARFISQRRATMQELQYVHHASYVDLVYRDCETFADALRTGDTAICEESYDVALRATGAALDACDAVMSGTHQAIFSATRPPGHHATANQGMGFCIFNHVAIAARYLQEKHGLKRIAIIDWDVHHGNGTEAIFLEDANVFYASLHEDHIYPFTGSAGTRGAGAGLGTTLNLPLPHASDGAIALEQWDKHLTPALEAFAPEFILLSAGFDARIDDPIGGLRWDDETFAQMTRRTRAIADRFARGRIVSILEGGYNPQGLACAALAHLRTLL